MCDRRPPMCAAVSASAANASAGCRSDRSTASSARLLGHRVHLAGDQRAQVRRGRRQGGHDRTAPAPVAGHRLRCGRVGTTRPPTAPALVGRRRRRRSAWTPEVVGRRPGPSKSTTVRLPPLRRRRWSRRRPLPARTARATAARSAGGSAASVRAVSNSRLPSRSRDTSSNSSPVVSPACADPVADSSTARASARALA